MTQHGDTQTEKRQLRWYSISTWLALGVIAVHILTGKPVIGGLIHGLVWAVPISILLAAAALTIRFRTARLTRAMVLWTALRYGIISLGLLSLAAPFVAFTYALSQVEHYTVTTEKLRDEMALKADIPGIRAWTEEYIASLEDDPEETAFIRFDPDYPWASCIAKLQPFEVTLDREKRILNFTRRGRYQSRWGLTVAPKGTEPSGFYTLPLEDGAWVWHGAE